MKPEEIIKGLQQTRPALVALWYNNAKDDAMERAIDAFVEIDPNLDKCRGELTVVIIATVAAFKRESGEPVATAHV